MQAPLDCFVAIAPRNDTQTVMAGLVPGMTGHGSCKNSKNQKIAETLDWQAHLRFCESLNVSEMHSAFATSESFPRNIQISLNKYRARIESLTLPPGFE
jgi:hypothetical protein